ncbi:MAG: transcription-repair coupling factor [Vicinamibacteria bacterium]|nr:transcription-repair coupling factor [Vicinamibacteria bacterium]
MKSPASFLDREPGFLALQRAIEEGRTSHVTGLFGLARLLVPLASTERLVVFVAPHEKDLENLSGDAETLIPWLGSRGTLATFPDLPPRIAGTGPTSEEHERTQSTLALQDGAVRAVLISAPALVHSVAAPEVINQKRLSVRVGEELLVDMLLDHLDGAGYRREDPVVEAGAFARRGGIVDVFPPGRLWPLRIEFFGDRIDSLREFDPSTQRRRHEIDEVTLLPFGVPEGSSRLAIPQILPPHWLVVIDPEPALAEMERALHVKTTLHADLDPDDPRTARAFETFVDPDLVRSYLTRPERTELHEIAPAETAIHIGSRPAAQYRGDLKRLREDLKEPAGKTFILLGTPGRAQRLAESLFEGGIATGEDTHVEIGAGHLSRGIEFPHSGLRLLADGDVFPEEVHVHKRRNVVRSFLSDFRDLKPGDYVVHEDHGIGRFVGLESLHVLGSDAEFMVVSYQGGDLLRVPVESFHRIQKHRAAEGSNPSLDKLGGTAWTKTKSRVKRAMRDMAAELLKVHAERKTRHGFAFSPMSPWMSEFENAFEYEETPDQRKAIEDVFADMSSPTPMDRLVCGDVGYGKTEVAMRAAMRAVADGKQVAVLAPTTVLAFQHLQTFRRRFAPFPVTAEMVSRLRSTKENKEILQRASEGRVDIVIGTHRLLSKDAEFKDLGLVIVDEEQRFGVAAKERLKQKKTSIDSLTLSATPIPRTLQMGLSGLRDMSIIETPPRDRLAIQTMVVKFSKDLIATAIRHELEREGQVYVVHNRVESIYSLASMIKELVPEARVVVGHGSMTDSELEKSMLAFVEGRADVLVATTIVENGLDVPRANTLIVHRADRFGLAQLYQLRGRVGRSDRPAFAYLMVPPGRVLSEVAQRRLAAIREFSDLGSGFRLAALDLEMRGAGNLLGGEQSGHILAVGLDLYLKLLGDAVREMQAGGEASVSERTVLNLRIDLRLKAGYIAEARDRILIYKRAADAAKDEDIKAIEADLRDRFGPLPQDAIDLITYSRLRVLAESLGIAKVDRVGVRLDLLFTDAPPLDPAKLATLIAAWPGAKLGPQGKTLTVPLPQGAPLDASRAVLERLRSAKIEES